MKYIQLKVHNKYSNSSIIKRGDFLTNITMQELIENYGYMDELYKKDKNYSINKYPKIYKGFKIEYAIGRFNKSYYTAVNIKNNQHSHDVSEKLIYKICDCAYELLHKNSTSNMYEPMIRNKAMRLIGFYIK